MKKKIWILLLCAALLCSGCGRKEGDSGKNESVEPSASPDITESIQSSEPSASPEVIDNIPTAAGSQPPYWAQGTQIKGNLFQGLNLDGVGEADDEVYVGMYEYGDEYKRVIALRAHLGTGETLVEIYPVFAYQDYSFITGRIFSEDRDAVILGIQSGTSNYGATNIWVLKISPADPAKHLFAEMWAALDTTAWPDGKNLGIMQDNGSVRGLFSIYPRMKITRMTRMPEVVDIEGSPLQGLKVTIFEPSEMGGGFNEVENVIYWKDGLWKDEDGVSYLGKWEFLGDWTPVVAESIQSSEPSASPDVISNIPTSAGSQAPYWAQGSQIKGNLYQGLNLDGVGEADDEVYVGMYEYGDEYKRVIAIRAHLGTGETLVKIYPVFAYQDYSFMTGRIFSEDSDAVILGIQSGTSNYGATNLWVLKVSPADPAKHLFAEMWVALDTTAPPNGMSLDILKGYGSSQAFEAYGVTTFMTGYPEVVDIEGSPLQGLKVTVFDPKDVRKNLENVIYWKDGIWDDGNRAYLGKWEFLGDWTPVSE